MRLRRTLLLLLTLPLLLIVLPAGATVTKVRVRVVSRDAKVIGTHVGGARVTIRDARTHRILARGIQTGGTGDTKKIMVEPHERGATIYETEDTASFTASIEIERPTVVEVSAEGPLGFPQATRSATKTLLLVPGHDVLGEGILLEIHGFVVDILSPETKTLAPGDITVRAKMTMT